MRWLLPCRSLVVAVFAVSLAACAWRGTAPVIFTPEEDQLQIELTRDPFIRIIGREREDDGYITLRTMQGRTPVAYRFMPANDSGLGLVIRRIDDRQHLPVAWSEDQLGTGPAPRGISH